MKKVRIGIIGVGNMGRIHARYLADGQIANAELVAVSDLNPEALKWVRENCGDKIRTYQDSDAFFADPELDAVLIATPHYDHSELAIQAFANDLHVMVEKPAGVYTNQVQAMNEAAEKSGKEFAIMFCLRTMPIYQKVKDLIDSGELGEIRRINWIVTSAYRPQSYYDSGGWRATWAGEGGGVLMNQAPHQLDLWQWFCGMPQRVQAFCSFGKFHDIEVEDDVTAYMEYENGATGVFIASTSDAPGTNRLEITGNNGKLVVEDEKITFWRLRVPERQFNEEWQGGFGAPEVWKCEIPVGEGPALGIHGATTQSWVDGIVKGTPILTPGAEGMNMVQLANAMHLSTWTDQWVELPIDGDQFYEHLQQQIKDSTFVKKETTGGYLDANSSF